MFEFDTVYSTQFENWIPDEKLAVVINLSDEKVITDDFGNEVVPPLPDSYFSRLPRYYQLVLSVFPDPFSRTAALLSQFVATSTALVNYVTRFSRRCYGPALMAVVYGEGGQGKGVCNEVLTLLDDIDRRVDEEARHARHQHERREDAYNVRMHRLSATKKGEPSPSFTDDDIPERVDPFYPRRLKAGSKVTAAALEKLIIGAGKYPLLYTSTEIKTLVSSNRSKSYGSFLDIFNKAAMEEPVSKDLSTDSEHVSNPQPRLSVLVTGVIGDLSEFFAHGTSDGSPSRYLLMGLPTWKSSYDDPSDEKAEAQERLLRECRQLLTEVYNVLFAQTGRDLEMKMTVDQQTKCNTQMARLKENLINICPYPDISAFANRQRLLFRRLCMQLQLFKYIDECGGHFVMPPFSVLTLDDDIYDLTLEFIRYNAQQHMHAYNHYLRFNPTDSPNAESGDDLTRLYDLLPDDGEFTIAQAITYVKANELDLNERKVKRVFSTWSNGNDLWLIKRYDGKQRICYYRKNPECKKNNTL